MNIGGKQHYLRWAVEQGGEEIDILVQKHHNAHAAKRFLRRLLKGQRGKPWQLVTDKLRRCAAAHRNVLPSVAHDSRLYANDRDMCIINQLDD